MSTTPTRYRDWQSRLEAFIAERQRMPFAWAANDCCSFVADACLAISGHDPLAPHRGYVTELDAGRSLKREGGIEAVAASIYGDEIPPGLAQVADVGLVEIEGRASLVLCTGTGWTGPGAEGLVLLPFEAAITAWRVLKCRS